MIYLVIVLCKIDQSFKVAEDGVVTIEETVMQTPKNASHQGQRDSNNASNADNSGGSTESHRTATKINRYEHTKLTPKM